MYAEIELLLSDLFIFFNVFSVLSFDRFQEIYSTKQIFFYEVIKIHFDKC